MKEIPRSIWYISIAAVINRMGMMVLPFLALYGTSELKVSESEAGLLLTSFGIGSLISAPFVGKMSDRFGELAVIKFSLYSTGIFLFILSFVETYSLLLVLCFVFAIFSESFRPATLAFLSNQVTPEQRKTSFAIYRLAINFGMSIGPVLGGFLSTIDFKYLFYFDGTTALLSAFFVSSINWDKLIKKKVNRSAEEIGLANPKTILSDSKFLYFLLAVLPVSIVFFQHFSSMPLYLVEELGYEKTIFGLLVAFNTVIIIFLEVPLNNWMSGWKDKNSLAFGAFLTAIGFGALAFVIDFSAIALTIIVWTFGEMIFFPAASSMAAELSPDEKRGEYMGYFQMVFSLSLIIAPWMGTSILENYGGIYVWYVSFILGMISAVMFYLLKEKVPREI